LSAWLPDNPPSGRVFGRENEGRLGNRARFRPDFRAEGAIGPCMGLATGTGNWASGIDLSGEHRGLTCRP